MLDIKVYKYEKPNYVEIKGVLQGLPMHETVDDSLDTSSIIFNSPIENIVRLWQSIKIVADGFTKYFVVADIQTKNTHFIDDNDKYQYTVSLLEPTKYLEKVVCSSISFTNRTHTLKQQIERALLNAEPVEVGRNPRFRMSQRLIDFLGNTPGEDFPGFEKPLLREVLDAMLAVKNARCEVYEITNFNDIVIDYYDQTQLGKQITINESDLANRETVENIEYLASNIEAYGDNSFSENREPVWHPSPNGYAALGADGASLTTNNALIKAAFPIEKIVEFLIPVLATVVEQTTDGTKTYTILSHLDISSQIVDEETYNILPSVGTDIVITSDGSLNQENTISFTREGEVISASSKHKSGLFFSEYNIQKAIEQASYNIIILDSIKAKEIKKYKPKYGGVITNVEYAAYYFDITTFKYRIQYIPYIDAHVKLSKVNYTEVPSTLISNQSDKTIDLGRYGQKLYGQINRLGNKELTIDRVLNSISEAYEVLDYTEDGYVIVERDLAFYNEFIKAHYKLTKDFNNLSEKIGIDRKKRIYNIPLESFVRDILIKNNILISTTPMEDNSTMIKEFLKTFDTNPNYRYPITNVLVQTNVSDLFELPIASYTMATSIMFSFRFVDNYSAGNSSVGRFVGGVKQHPNKYVNDKGEYDSIHIRLFNDTLATRPQDYDSIKLLPKVEESYYSNAVIPFNKEYKITKDAYEHHQFTIQLEIISNDPNIVVGFAMAKLCVLVTSKVSELKLYVSTTEKYSVIDNQRPKGNLEPNQRITFTNLNYIIVDGDTFNNPQSIVSWGITDENNNLLVGVNSNVDRLYFGWRHQRV